MSNAEPIHILVADDHPIFRRGLRDVIEEDGRYHVVAECGDGQQAVFEAQRLCPAIAVLDLEMPRLDGLEAGRLLRELPAPPKLIYLTMHDTAAIFKRAFDIGACGYILKDGAADEIVTALDEVTDGRVFVSPALSERLVAPRKRSADDVESSPLAISTLTKAERRVLHLIAENRTSDEIASMLNISPRTVEGHRSNITRKLSLSGSYALVRFALLHRDKL